MYRKFMRELKQKEKEAMFIETKMASLQDENERDKLRLELESLEREIDHRAKRNYGI